MQYMAGSIFKVHMPGYFLILSVLMCINVHKIHVHMILRAI